MIELILLVLVFLSSQVADYAILAIIVVYGIWSIYMKTYQPDVWFKLQEADDRRRASVLRMVGRAGQDLAERIGISRSHSD